MSAVNYLVVMGAAVNASGKPSGAMRRRLDAALFSCEKYAPACFLVTGGVGKHGDAEAVVMKRYLVAHGILEANIVLDTESDDTLKSAINCARILKQSESYDTVLVFSDRYHLVRCVWLFKILGIPAHPGYVPSGKQANGIFRWTYYYVRDAIALPYDLILAFFFRLSGGR